MHSSSEPAEQICRQGDSDPVSALLLVGVQLFLSALAGPLPDPAHLQVGQGMIVVTVSVSVPIPSSGGLFVELYAL